MWAVVTFHWIKNVAFFFFWDGGLLFGRCVFLCDIFVVFFKVVLIFPKSVGM